VKLGGTKPFQSEKKGKGTSVTLSARQRLGGGEIIAKKGGRTGYWKKNIGQVAKSRQRLAADDVVKKKNWGVTLRATKRTNRGGEQATKRIMKGSKKK